MQIRFSLSDVLRLLTPVILGTCIILLFIEIQPVQGAAAPCGSTPADFGVEKKILPAGGGRPGGCNRPDKLVLHTTNGPQTTIQQYYDFFAGAGVASHFIVDKEGNVAQFVEMYTDTAEVAYTVAGYNMEQVSIEIIHTGNYGSKADMPVAQYNAVYALVRKIMQQYSIPLGTNEYTFQTPTDGHVDLSPGVYGHYQLNPESRSDPGIGLHRDIRTDIANNLPPTSGGPGGGVGQPSTSCVITKVGEPVDPPPPLPPACTQGTGGPGGNASSCPIPNGTVTCGSQATPINNCGHCGIGYDTGSVQCTNYQGTKFAIDIGAPANAEIIFPKVGGNDVEWTHVYSSGGVEDIQGYAGTDTVTGAKYYMQFHHTTRGSGVSGRSGQVGATVWASGNHVHVQIANGGGVVGDAAAWFDAATTFCR